MLVLARAASWRASQGVILAGANLIVGSFFVAFLRPQSILLITFPLLWAATFFVLQGKVTRGAWLLLVASVVTANFHLFFPLTIAPVALLWTERGDAVRARDKILAVCSVLLGWVLSPYAAHWPSVFRHNFSAVAMLRPPSAISELQPGFVSVLHPLHPLILLVAAMLALPWVLGQAPLRRRERLLLGVYWLLGVILFGYATRLFVAWWALSMVTVGLAIVQVTRTVEEGAPRARFRVLLLFAAIAIVSIKAMNSRIYWSREGSVERRTLPTVETWPAEKLARVLVDHTVSGARGKVLTTFTFGSYLTWRLPGYSESIDSRGIFPDSVSRAEAFVMASDRDMALGPWRSADIAIVPLRYRVAEVLDTASSWRRLAATRDDAVPTDSVGLWVTKGWWQQNRRSEGPATPR
jgi:hypothetical protein